MFIKRICLIAILFLVTLIAFCQHPNAADAQAQIKKAQQMMDSIKKAHPEIQDAMNSYKKQMPGVQKMMDSIKKAQPGIIDSNAKMPDMPQTPDFDKLSNTIGQSSQTINNIHTSFASSNAKGLPQKSSSAFTVNKTDRAQVLLWAKSMYEAAKAKAGILLQPLLDNTYNDTSSNAASAGMMMIATGFPKCTGQYLVCKYLIEHPKSASALNDLGIFFRIDKDYTKAIGVFLYAKSINDTSLEITTNLAWTYAYAGNFIEAKKYFNKVLSINPKYGSAIEGMSLLAYQEGDMQTFWNSLTQQLLYNSKSNGLGMAAPSGQMASFCDAVLTEEEMDKINGGDGGNTAGNLFNGMPPPDPDGQSTESNVPVDDDIDYPSYTPDFPDDMQNLTPDHCMAAQSNYQKAKQKDLDYIMSLLSTLPKPQQFINSDGDLETIYDYSNDAHYKFFYKIHQQFEKRSTAVFADSRDKLERAISATIASWNGEMQAFNAALAHCTDKECRRAIICDYLPRLAGILKNFGMSVGDIVTSGMNKLDDETGWYLNASSPMLQYISEPNWNKYLNAIREVDIRSLKLNLMELYQHAMQLAAGYVVMAKGIKVEVSCVFELRIMPQKKESKYKELKTLAPPCNGSYDANKNSNPNNLLNPRQTKVDLGPIHYVSDCNHEKLVLDEGKFGTSTNLGIIKGGAEITKSQFWETVHSKFVEDDYTRSGIELHAKASMGISKSVSEAAGDVNITGSGGVKAEAEATVDFFKQFDQFGNQTKQGVAFDATAKVSGSIGAAGDILGIDDSKTDIMKEGFQKGMEVSGEIWAVVGADKQLGNYQYSNMKTNVINK